MKIKTLLSSIAVLSLLMACSKDKLEQDITVVKDCSGSYLKIDGEDYLICNHDIVENHEDGAIVDASYEIVVDCPSTNDTSFVCMLYHQHEGLILVSSIE